VAMTKIAIAVCVVAAGCYTTKHEGSTMRRDIKSLTDRLDTKEKVLDDQIAQLKSVLEDATKVLKRNSADLGADVETLRNDMRTATGLVTAVNTGMSELRAQVSKQGDRLAALETKVASLDSRTPNPADPKSAEEMWSLGKTAFEAGRWDEARDLFRKLTIQFPGHDRADDAQYFRGEATFKKGDLDGAIGEYRKVFDKYPDSTLADDALFRGAEAAYSLKNCAEARAYLGLLKQKYPKSSLVKQAEAKDKVIRGALKNKSKCTG
jgi:tol-pal system protein YbgF